MCIVGSCKVLYISDFHQGRFVVRVLSFLFFLISFSFYGFALAKAPSFRNITEKNTIFRLNFYDEVGFTGEVVNFLNRTKIHLDSCLGDIQKMKPNENLNLLKSVRFTARHLSSEKFYDPLTYYNHNKQLPEEFEISPFHVRQPINILFSSRAHSIQVMPVPTNNLEQYSTKAFEAKQLIEHYKQRNQVVYLQYANSRSCVDSIEPTVCSNIRQAENVFKANMAEIEKQFQTSNLIVLPMNLLETHPVVLSRILLQNILLNMGMKSRALTEHPIPSEEIEAGKGAIAYTQNLMTDVYSLNGGDYAYYYLVPPCVLDEEQTSEFFSKLAKTN